MGKDETPSTRNEKEMRRTYSQRSFFAVGESYAVHSRTSLMDQSTRGARWSNVFFFGARAAAPASGRFAGFYFRDLRLGSVKWRLASCGLVSSQDEQQ